VAGDPAADLQARLREDLRTAMRARASAEVALLRMLIAAVDNAQSVPVGEGHQRYVERPFGDGSAEVPRLDLTTADVNALLQREAAARDAAAAEFARVGAADREAVMREEARLVRRYL
jgi:uncharacterized protein YqeY